MTLDGNYMRTRRIASTLSLTIAADLLGVSRLVLQRIESGDEAALRQVTVTGLVQLASALRCRPQDFFDVHQARDGEPSANEQEFDSPSAASSSTPAARLAGFLLIKRAQVTIKETADALGWTRQEVLAAKAALPEQLHGTGIRLALSNDTLQLVPEEYAAAERAIKADVKAKVDRRGINDGVARVLRSVVRGDLGPGGNHSVFTRNALATLTTLGAIDTTSAPEPSPALLYALDRQ